MKRIGLLGGMSWESSIEYERIINEAVRDRLGGVHSADLWIRSFDFANVEALQVAGDWDAAGRLLAAAAVDRLADVVSNAVSVPLLHIADATAEAILMTPARVVALLGTRYTMEGSFYRSRLSNRYGLDVRVPESADRELVHRVIYDELVQGIVSDRSRARLLAVIDRMVAAGCEGVIAGCTEIELLIVPSDVSVPYFSTTRLHALAAVNAALG